LPHRPYPSGPQGPRGAVPAAVARFPHGARPDDTPLDPETQRVRLVVVGVDFSDGSAGALQTGRALAGLGGSQVFVVHVRRERSAPWRPGRSETAWLRETFPLVSTVMTSAATGSGVEAVFSGVIDRAVDEQLAEDRRRHQARLLRHAILAFVSRKGSLGASKTDLFATFKTVMPASLVEELDHLVRLDLLRQEESGPKTFVKTASMPADFRFKSTPQGQKIAESPSMEELVVYESR